MPESATTPTRKAKPIEGQCPGIPPIVSVVGDIDDVSDENFRASLSAAARARPARLIVDLRLAGHFGSHGVNSLVATWQEMTVFGGDLLIANPSQVIREVLAVCRVDELPGFVIEPSPASQ